MLYRWIQASWPAGLALVLAVAVVYWGSLDAPFVLDDMENIRTNPATQSLWPLARALNPPPFRQVSFFTRPFINFTMCLDHEVWGRKVRGYRFTNLLFHAAAAVALVALVRRTLVRAGRSPDEASSLGFAAALLWAVHPLNTAAVNYLSQRGELAVGLFLFLLLYALHRAGIRTARGGTAFRWLIPAVFVCLLGMGSKETMAAAPLLAMAYDRIFLCASWKELFSKRWWFYGALALTWLWPLSRHLAYSPHLPEAGLPADAYWRYPLTQAWGVARMLRLSVWPHPLIFDYGPELVNRWQEVWAHGFLMMLLLGATLWFLWRRPRIGFSALVFFALLAPSSSFLPIPGQPLAEHRMYTSLAGVMVLLVLLVERLCRIAASRWRRPAETVFLVVVLLWGLALAATSHARHAAYLDAGVLWEDTLAKRPGNSRAYAATGRFLFAAGRHQEGLARLQEAVRLRPDVAMNHNNLGNALAALGRFEEAMASFREALRIEPDLAEARFNLANLLSKAQRHDEALEHYRQAAEAHPDHAMFWYYTGMTHAQLGRFADAAEAVDRVLSLQADYPGAAQARQRIAEEIRRGASIKDGGHEEQTP